MAKAAEVAVTLIQPHTERALLDRAAAPAKESLFRRVWATLSSIRDRISAKLAFHNSHLYTSLAARAFRHAQQPNPDSLMLRRLRQIDPAGLGIWYLAKGGEQPRLDDLCQRAIELPGIGPPRAIARALDRARAGQPTCWFGESSGFSALMAESLISAAQGATLVAARLLWSNDLGALRRAADHLTRTAAAAQTAGRAHDRVAGQALPAAQEATRWVFQSVNLLRRGLNHTDLFAIDEQIAREAARQALAAASSGCAAALTLCTSPPKGALEPERSAARDKLAALARTVDALASRVSAWLRADSQPSIENVIAEQSGRVLAEAAKSMRLWSIELPCTGDAANTNGLETLCVRANDLAELSAEALESWAILHEVWLAETTSAESRPAARSKRPPWADRLVRVTSGTMPPEGIVEAIRNVSGRSESAVAAGVGLSVLRFGSLKLRRELWKLIRAATSSPLERSLAFQCFLRLDNR
jgi:hypothetical protein